MSYATRHRNTCLASQLQKLAILLTGLLLMACSSAQVSHDYCQIAHPIYLQKGEAAKLSDATAREILTANETWAKVCQSH